MKAFPLAAQVLISAALLITFSTSSAFAQFSIGGIKIPKINLPQGMKLPNIPGINLPDIPTLGSLLNDKVAVTTSVQDVVGEIPFLDDYSPSNVFPLNYCRHGEHGSWILKPGLYGEDLQSYCLHAGTYGPSHGDGYIYAPLKGGRATIIKKILTNSADHPELPQHDVQSFIWTIEAKAKFDNMGPNLKTVGQTLLSPSDIFDLNGGVLAYIPESEQEKLFGNADAAMRPILEAQNQIRNLSTQANIPFAEMERYAVLAGDPPPNPGNREVPRGRWNYLPDGFFIRYIPSGYSRTHVDVYVPEHYSIRRDAKGRISVLATNDCVMEVTYQPDAIAENTDGSVAAYAFDTIRVSVPDDTKPKLIRTSEWKASGWTLVGQMTDDSLTGVTPPSGMDARIEASKVFLTQLGSFQDQFKTLHKGNWASQRDIVDIASLRLGVSQAYGNNQKFEPNDTHLLERVWQSAFCSWVSGAPLETDQIANHLPSDNARVTLASYQVDAVIPPTDSPTQEIQVGGEVAVPVNTGRQRLGISPRPISPNGPYKLTIYVITQGLGHSFISLSDGQTINSFGFYPLNGGAKVIIQDTGIIRTDNINDYNVKKEYTISKEQLAAAYQGIVDWDYDYDLEHHNCTSFATTIAIDAGVMPDDFSPRIHNIPNYLAQYLLSVGGTSSGSGN